MSFQGVVEKLRRWIVEYPFSDLTSAEWESEYPDWPEVWSAAMEFTTNRPVKSWSVDEMDDMLFAIARDNEMGEVVLAVEVSSDTLIAVATAALARGTPDAKWQLAAQLGEGAADQQQAVDLLLRFLDDADEYVRRRALLAMGALRPEGIETYVERAWQSGLEYQRIAALHVLAEAGSNQLAKYLQSAVDDGRVLVLAAADRARQPDRLR